jgi:hypothetical protein
MASVHAWLKTHRSPPPPIPPALEADNSDDLEGEGGAVTDFSLIGGGKAGGKLPSWSVPIRYCERSDGTICESRQGLFVGESWSEKTTRVVDANRGLAVIGSSRMFYALSGARGIAPKQWMDVKYDKLDLLDKSLSFTIDLSEVPCGSNAAVCMPKSPHAERCWSLALPVPSPWLTLTTARVRLRRRSGGDGSCWAKRLWLLRHPGL